MKRFRKTALSLCTLIVISSILFGCGASSAAQAQKAMGAYATDVAMAEMPMMAYSEAKTEEQPVQQTDFAEKIIYTANLSMETLEFDKTTEAMIQSVSDFGGFVERSSVYGDTSYDATGNVNVENRSADYTFRIPAEKLDAYLEQMGTLGNVTSKTMEATNVTSQYTDYEARLASLKTEQTRLLELLQKAENVENLLAIESKLTDVRYEIDSVERNLKNLDNQVSYSTVSIYLREVRIYTASNSVHRSLWQRIGDAFVAGWRGFVEGIGDFAVFLSGAFFTIVLIVLLVFAVTKIILHRRKRKAKKTETPTE